MSQDAVSSNEVLNSWKEIAAYLNRGVRTVQRWEIELNLPVRRPRGKSRSAVLALRPELDEWIHSCPLEHRAGYDEETGEHSVVPLGKLIVQSRVLRLDMVRSRHEMETALAALMASVARMSPETLAQAAVVPIPDSEHSA